MSMGGGGGASESPADRMRAAYMAGITDPQALEAIGRGMTPMSYENFRQGKTLVTSAFPDIQKYGREMAGLAGGGLLTAGMKQLNEANRGISQVPGMMDRMAARYGMDSTKQHSPGGYLDTSMQDVGAKIGTNNQAKTGLVNAMRGLRLQGIQV